MTKELLCPIDKLAKGIMCCYDNAKQLIEDAKLLFKHKRYARAVALAIIALEEYGKAEELLGLTSPISPKELDTFIKRRFRDHHGKQMAACEEEFVRTMKGKSQSWYHIADKSQFISKEKENSLYVNMNNRFDFTSPVTATRHRSQIYIAFVARKIYDGRGNPNYEDVLDEIKEKHEGELGYLKETG